MTECEFADDVPRLPAPVEDALYRIAQEALNNVRWDSRATSVRLKLGADEGYVYLRIRDIGTGFSSAGPSIKRGFGITSMRERARLLGGELEVRSHKTRGTVITAKVPLQQAARRGRRPRE